MRALLGAALLVAPLASVNAGGEAGLSAPRFDISEVAITAEPPAADGGRYRLRSLLLANSGRASLQGSALRLQARLEIEGGGCTPMELVFADGFESPP